MTRKVQVIDCSTSRRGVKVEDEKLKIYRIPLVKWPQHLCLNILLLNTGLVWVLN